MKIKFHGKLPFFIDSKIELLGSLPTRHFCVENTNSADWALSKEKYTPVLDRNRVWGLGAFALKYLPNSHCYGRMWDTCNVCYFSVAYYRSSFWSPTGFLGGVRGSWSTARPLQSVEIQAVHLLESWELFIWVWHPHFDRWLMPHTVLQRGDWREGMTGCVFSGVLTGLLGSVLVSFSED